MKEPKRRQYLAAMGIQLWRKRDAEWENHELSDVIEQNSIQKIVPSNDQNVSNLTSSEDQISGPPPWITEAPPVMDEITPPIELDDPLFSDFQSPVHDSEIASLDWDSLEKKVANCTFCELHSSRKNAVFGIGDKNADLMVIGEAPGADEDRQGEPFVGRAGQLLNAMLQAIGFTRKQVFIANILKCRPPANRNPYPEEALRCEPYLMRQIALVKPKVILAVGRVAAQNLLKTEETVGNLRGKNLYVELIPTVVTYHPAYLLRKPQEKAKSWRDLQHVVKMLTVDP